MIQDIAPKIFYNQYQNIAADDEAYIIYACGNRALLKEEKGVRLPPKVKELTDRIFYQSVYLFSIDGQRFFMPNFQDNQTEEDALELWRKESGYEMVRLSGSGVYEPKWMYFACAAAIQLNNWYHNNRFCGHCGKKLLHKDNERALYCCGCGNIVYPKISPAVIVGVVYQDKILMTKYADHRDGIRYSLIAGFSEVGEAVEDTVRREVMEEVGVRVKNIRYYKSQPWPFSDTLLLGFFCELDGNEKIILDEKELSEAEWIARENMEMTDDGISLTYEMMDYFKNNKEAF